MTRQEKIIRTGYYGVGCNICVASGKAMVGFASGSIAIVMDAVNNLTDALSSVLTIVGAKLAGRPADDKHPFGYGRVEYFTAVVIAALVLVAGGTSLKESIEAILEPEEQQYSLVGVCILVATVVVKFMLGVYTRRKGKELSSDSLLSSGTECLYDCVVSVSTLLSVLIVVCFGVSLDSWLAAIISCLIIKAGIEMLMAPINELLGRSNDPHLTAEIKTKVKTVEGVRGVYDVVLHDYGPEQKIGALHVEVDETLHATVLHLITRRIQHLLWTEYGIFVTVGFYAHHQPGTPQAQEEARIRQHVLGLEYVEGLHGFHVDTEARILSFDIVYSFGLKNPISLRNQVIEWLKPDYEGYDIYIGLDRKY